MPVRFERDSWTATLAFGAGVDPAPVEVAALIGRLNEVFAAAQVQWQMPAFSGAPPLQIELQADGTSVSLPVDLLVGTSMLGWQVQASARRLVVRYQTNLSPGGMRLLPSAEPPSPQEFSTLVLRAIEAYPPTLVRRCVRTSLAGIYAAHTGNVYPPSWVAAVHGVGSETEYPPPDGARFVAAHHEQQFETIAGARYVWNEVTRIGNWFGEKGLLARGTAVLRDVSLMDAAPEPRSPDEQRISVDNMPPLPGDRRTDLYRDARGLRLILERIGTWLPKGASLHG
jgi:hypothetical protein